uniref:Piezo type mechanosensitive ion channel component 1 (Er blood group) n=1 Tax=Sphenodon punctatus TaxID=8508 RepID=A0A8D0GQJ7_SPHPU
MPGQSPTSVGRMGLALRHRSLGEGWKYPQPKGQKKKKIVKYGMGGLIILFLICIIWFPLLFMSLVRSVVGVVNHPIDVTVTLKLGGYEVGWRRGRGGFLAKITPGPAGTDHALMIVHKPYRVQESALGLAIDWIRAAPRMDLGKGGTVEYSYEKHTMDLAPNSSVRSELAALLEGARNASVRVPKLFPPYIRAPNGPDAKPVKQLLPEDEESYLDVEVQLKRQQAVQGSSRASFLEWWVIQLSNCRQQDCKILPMVVFNDKDPGPVRLHRAGDREVRPRLLQRDLALHHVRGAALRGPHPQALPRHLPGAGDGRAGVRRGAVRQAYLPLPLPRDHDQMDP